MTIQELSAEVREVREHHREAELRLRVMHDRDRQWQRSDAEKRAQIDPMDT